MSFASPLEVEEAHRPLPTLLSNRGRYKDSVALTKASESHSLPLAHLSSPRDSASRNTERPQPQMKAERRHDSKAARHADSSNLRLPGSAQRKTDSIAAELGEVARRPLPTLLSNRRRNKDSVALTKASESQVHLSAPRESKSRNVERPSGLAQRYTDSKRVAQKLMPLMMEEKSHDVKTNAKDVRRWMQGLDLAFVDDDADC